MKKETKKPYTIERVFLSKLSDKSLFIHLIKCYVKQQGKDKENGQ